ncbi:uncharacterized protein LOC129737719 [Uranotaenia lowii]|uniref:uncharacterized protein LOC129737719 n=1 Tax=Uranotaenia lowii TaxID=190385 RepID=UPI00247A8F80|nr:uncharacterized protein LOC129737719 [Uranotaenia lowii]
MASRQDFTITACEKCGETSTQDEGMVGCNGCAGWFHYRCVGVTDEVKKQKKWFCPSEACQQLFYKFQRKQEAGRKGALKKTEGSDKSSTTSEQRMSLWSENKDETIRMQDTNQSVREETHETEKRHALEKQDMEIEAMTRQYELEAELRERKLKLEEQMLKKALNDKRMYLEKAKKMRESYQSQMDAMDKELAELSIGSKTGMAKGGCSKTSTPVGKSNVHISKNSSKLPKRGSSDKDTSSDLESSTTDSIMDSSFSDSTDIVNTLAFLDEGASVTLIENCLAKRLNLVGQLDPLTIKWTADVTRTEKDSIRADMQISSKANSDGWMLRGVRTVSQLLLPMQTLNAEELKMHYPFLTEVPVQSFSGERPGLLIGLNNLDVIAPLETKLGNVGDPIAVRSKLGWSIYGPIGEAITCSTSGYVGIHVEPTNQEIHDLLKLYYSVDESVESISAESKEDQRARRILETTTMRIGDRFETGLLWNTDSPWFPNSYGMAFGRMQELERRLINKPQLYGNVCSQIEQYLQKGYAHIATDEELSETNSHQTWYLPLNVVLNKKKPDKVRLVWDAAASVKGVSLNSQLLKGPDMTVSLPAVISRFRERRVAFGADLKEMYHQIRIRTEDRQVQRFLFRTDRSKPPTTYVMDVATFGATCSPCSAQYVKNLNASEFATEYPKASAAIVNNHYVDDYFDSVDTVEQAIELATQVRYIHIKGGFEIRNWVSNSRELLIKIGEPNAIQSIQISRNKETNNERVLGIIWNPHDDMFSFSTTHRDEVSKYLHGDSRPTKRIVLSCVMGFFDPLGLLSPFTVLGKMLIQDLWRTGCEWDEQIDDDSYAKWKKWISMMSQVENVRIDRCYLGSLHSKDIESLQLHVFTDASEHAYGCAVYLRSSWQLFVELKF